MFFLIRQTEVGQWWRPYWKKSKNFFFAFLDILSIFKHNLDTFDFSRWLTPWRPSWIGGHLEKIKKKFFCTFGLKPLSNGLFCKFLKFQDGGHWYLGPSGRCAAAKRSSLSFFLPNSGSRRPLIDSCSSGDYVIFPRNSARSKYHDPESVVMFKYSTWS